MNLIKSFLIVLAGYYATSGLELNAQTGNKDYVNSIEEIISQYENEDRFSGALIVIDKGEVIFNGYYGYSDKKSGKLIGSRSIFGLASVSKVFTSSAIMRLVEEGKISLGDKLDSFFPDLPTFYSRVSLENLLTHTSGIPDFHAKPVFDVHNSDIYNFVARQKELEFEPGTEYKYSNTGFVLLAMVVEKVENISFPDYLEREFFRPLGMEDTFIGRSEKKNRIVKSYLASGEIADRANFYYGPGEQYTTASDMVKWDKAYFSAKVIGDALMKKVLTAHKLPDGTETNYGLGWGILKLDAGKIVGHTGGNYGYRTIYMHNLTLDSSVILLTNIGDKCPTMEIVMKIMAVI